MPESTQVSQPPTTRLQGAARGGLVTSLSTTEVDASPRDDGPASWTFPHSDTLRPYDSRSSPSVPRTGRIVDPAQSMIGGNYSFYDPAHAQDQQPVMDYQQWVDAYAQGQGGFGFFQSGGHPAPSNPAFQHSTADQQPLDQPNQHPNSNHLPNQYHFVQQPPFPGSSVPSGSFDPQIAVRKFPNRNAPQIGRSVSAGSYGHNRDQNENLYYPALSDSEANHQPISNGGMPAPDYERRTPSDRVYTPSSDAHFLPSSIPSSSSSPSHVVPAPYEQAMPMSATLPANLGAAQASSGGRPRTTPRKRQRREGKESDGSIDTEAFLTLPPTRGPEPLISGRLPGACTHCKKLKMKCDFPKDQNVCRRCKASGHTCIVEGRKPRSAPNKREYLLSQIRQKDAIIESLLKQLHNPYLATPLSIAAYRMSTAPPDQQNQNVKQWLERLQSSIRTHNGPNTLKGAASRSREMVEDASDESDNEDQAAGDDAEWEDLDDCLVTSDSKLIPDAAVPLGLFADLSLDQARSTKAKSDAGADENKDGEDDDVGVANETYFLPGPATDLRMRAKLIESYSPPEILLHGLVTPDDVDKLFDIFFKRVNIWLPLLDPVLHTPSTVFARCPFLFTCICAISSRYSPEKSEIYSIAMHFAKSEASNALIHGWKTVELCQAYLLMSMYGVPAKRWEEDRSWLYTGLAIRIAMDLNLHVPPQTKPQNERQEREVLNRTRAWMLCFNQDRSTATQFGKPWTIKEDYIIRNAGDFYKTSRFNSPYDIHMCGYNQLLRLLGRVHSDIYSDPSSPLGINQHADLRPLIMNHDHSLNQYYEEWQMRFDQDSDPNDPVCVVRAALLPYVINYSRLVMWSFPFQQAFQRGISADDQLVFTTCMNAAKSLIRVMIERLVPTGLMRYSPDGWFLFSSFASAFLLKLLRPEFAILRTPQDEHEILEVISRLIQILSSPEIALDDRHAPKLYARFLAGLLTKHRQDGMVPQDRQTPQPPHHQVQYGTGNPGGHQMQPSASNQIYSLSQQQGAYGGGQDYGAQQMSLHSSLPPVMLAPPEDDALLSAVSSNPGSGFGGSMDGTLYPPSAQPSPGSPEMTLASMQAIKNPAWWESMMMPGFAWPVEVNQASYGPFENIQGISPTSSAYPIQAS